jgi:multidrug efflux pump subunit AcrA (membrane-fusion protein)
LARPRTVYALALCALACGGEAAPPPATAKVERGRIERVVVATGTIEPAREVEVRPRIPGIVERIHVEPGDAVETGQLLVEIDRELLASQAAEAEAALREAESRTTCSPRSISTTCARATRPRARG